MERRNQRTGGAEVSRENGKGRWEKEEKGGNSSWKEAGGRDVLCRARKGQLDSLQAAIAQNYTPTHTQSSDAHRGMNGGLNFIIRLQTCPSISINKIVSPLAEGIGLKSQLRAVIHTYCTLLDWPYYNSSTLYKTNKHCDTKISL